MVSRRALLGATSAGVAAGAAGMFAIDKSTSQNPATERLQFRAANQLGIEAGLQAHTVFLSLNLRPDVTKADMLRLMTLLTDDIERLTQGKPVLADQNPEFANENSNTTVTVGFGPSLFSKLQLEDQMPLGFAELPSFKVDRLEPEFSGGDVLLHVSSNDPVYLSHAIRMLALDAHSFATVHSHQEGFAKTLDGDSTNTRQRNLMGQIDGTDNPEPGTEDFSKLVWITDGPDWIKGGTTLVLRRIAMALNTWDTLGRTAKEEVIGRKLDNGAPLGGKTEKDFPDFNATTAGGLSVIPKFAHIRRATAYAPNERFFRKPFNYDNGFNEKGEPDVGLLWTAYARNIEEQYLPVQRRLDEFDLLNTWTTPIGSSVWAIPRGPKAGEVIAQDLFG